MGKALQIRVSAVTWNESLVKKLWPRLSELTSSIPNKHTKFGVLEMVQSLSDGLNFMDWPEKRKLKLGSNIEKAVDITRCIENALASWNPHEANTLSDQLEDILNTLENDCI